MNEDRAGHPQTLSPVTEQTRLAMLPSWAGRILYIPCSVKLIRNTGLLFIITDGSAYVVDLRERIVFLSQMVAELSAFLGCLSYFMAV